MTATLTVLLITALAFGELAHLLGLHNILGAFMAGLFLRKVVSDQREYRELTHRIHDMAIGFLAPIFFVIAGFDFQFSVFKTSPGLVTAVVGAAILGKLAGTMLFYLPSGNGWREGLAIGLGMNGRGAVEIIVAGIALQRELISQDVYSSIVFMAIFTTALVPITLKWCVVWMDRRQELVRIQDRNGYLILGAGPLARQVAKVLGETCPVRLIDRNPDNCLAARREGLTAIEGNALDAAVLADAKAIEVQGIVAVTPNPDINLLAATFARDRFLVPDLYVSLAGNRAADFEPLLIGEGVDVYARRTIDLVEWDRSIQRDQFDLDYRTVVDEAVAEELATEVRMGTVLPLAFTRNGRRSPVAASLEFQPGDVVVLLRQKTGDTVQIDRFDRLVTTAPILDLDGPLSLDAFLARAADTMSPLVGLPSEALLTAYRTRERDTGTVLGQGVAIPHVVIPGERQLHLLVARCREGIDFGGGDDHVHTVFVLAGTRDERNTHLRCLSAVAQIVQSPQFETRWFQAEGADQLRHLLLTAKRRKF